MSYGIKMLNRLIVFKGVGIYSQPQKIILLCGAYL
jgi:hypothetical protein